MADVTNELIYEVLKSIQDRLTSIENEQRASREELNALRGHQIAMQQDVHNIYEILGELKARMQVIERRLELSPAE